MPLRPHKNGTHDRKCYTNIYIPYKLKSDDIFTVLYYYGTYNFIS